MEFASKGYFLLLLLLIPYIQEKERANDAYE